MPAKYFKDIDDAKLDRKQLTLARELIRKKSATFRPDKFTDNDEAALREMIDAKLKHVAVPKHEAREPRGEVINLMDALRRSVSVQRAGKKPVAHADGKPAKHRAGKQELRVVSTNTRAADKHRKSA